MQTASRPRVYDHNDECVGCGAHLCAPCDPTCGFETGEFRPSLVLRAAAQRLCEFPIHKGADIAAAIAAAAAALRPAWAMGDGPDADELINDTRAALGAYFDRLTGPDAALPNVAMIDPYGHLMPRSKIAATLYLAAFHADDIEPDITDDEFVTYDQCPVLEHRHSCRT